VPYPRVATEFNSAETGPTQNPNQGGLGYARCWTPELLLFGYGVLLRADQDTLRPALHASRIQMWKGRSV
jgi:hypothetical protein